MGIRKSFYQLYKGVKNFTPEYIPPDRTKINIATPPGKRETRYRRGERVKAKYEYILTGRR